MAVISVLVLIAVGAVGFWWLRRRGPKASGGADAPSAAPVKSLTPERRPGRMINIGETACPAAQKIQAAWYAEGEVPRLPLETCGHPQTCRCTWMRVLDRRVTHRRLSTDRRSELRFEDKSDRREGHDRRDPRGNVWKNSG